ncbi:MAG TPA: hypothetical protein VG944_23685 [Fimbriimonas sp.]|nr:hypothetical protein [Fimbriimonas sp.]
MRSPRTTIVLLLLALGILLQACASNTDAGPVDQTGKKGGTAQQRSFKEGN